MNELLHKFKLGNDAELLLEKRGGGYEKVATVPIGSQALGVTQSAQGVVKGVAPSGTVAADGTITLGTALPGVFSAGVLLYLPAGAIVSGAAGFYWCDMSSTTLGVVRAGKGGAALVGSGSAYTGVTSEIVCDTVAIPLKTDRTSSVLRTTGSVPANTNSKTARIRLTGGGAQLQTFAITSASHATFTGKIVFTACGDLAHAAAEAIGGGSNGGFVAITDGAVIVDLTLQLGVATDYALIAGTVVLS